MLAQTTLSFSDFKHKPLEDTLKYLVKNRQALIIQFPDGTEIMIRPKPALKPLPVLKGFVPAGWKEAIYAPDE